MELLAHHRRGSGVLTGDLADIDAEKLKIAGPLTILNLCGATANAFEDSAQIEAQVMDAYRLAKSLGAIRFVQASSYAVYEPGTAWPDEAAPRTYIGYGGAKRRTEDWLLAQDDLPLTILRLANVAGADSLQLSQSDELSIDQWPDGSDPVRSYVSPIVLADCLRQIANEPGAERWPPVLNFATAHNISMADLAAEAGAAINRRSARADARQFASCDCSKARRVFAGLRLQSTSELAKDLEVVTR